MVIPAKIAGNVGEEMINIDGEPINKFIIEALKTDGGHHKQWYLEQILIALGYNLKQEKEKEALRQFNNDKDYWMKDQKMTKKEAIDYLKENAWEEGIPP